jgi:uncharacterized DUF497 family protein
VILWDERKSLWLKSERGISFEQVTEKILAKEVLDILAHRSRPNQRIFVIEMDGSVCAVPFVMDEQGNIILKTAYPSRKLQKAYRRKREEKT